ncbi:MAG: hypothetical protein D4R57_01030 [Verrucomicrobiales bacterium]|nr:MAG: hypothetical protein D4R57_01030 [Verrucomicrobiales bacterium]
MNTIKCRIKVDDFSDVPGEGVTPAEVIVARTLFDKIAGGCCIKKARASGHAMTQTGVRPGKIKQTDVSGIEVEMKIVIPVERERTDAEELIRLRSKYKARAKSGAPDTHICDDLFGGAGLVAKLPQTFDELPARFKQGLNIELPEKAETIVEDVPRGTSEPTSNPETGPREDLLGRSKAELVKIAGEYQIENTAKLNKAELIEAILSKAGYAEPATV